MDNEAVYLRRRASDERTAALQARNPPARKAHVAMAEEYESRVRNIFSQHGSPTSIQSAAASETLHSAVEARTSKLSVGWAT